MSSNKKSVSSAILIFIIFALIAAGSWFFFSGQKDNILAHDESHAGHDHGKDEAHTDTEDTHAGHGHNDVSASTSADTSDMVGVRGTVHQLNQPAIYGERGEGNPNAPIKIQEFYSLTCNHCAEFHKGAYQDIKQNLIDTGKVYFIHEEFPLNGPALYGSMIARCLPEERYSGFVDILLRTQDKWAFGGDFKASLMQNAKLAGMSEEEFNTCFDNKDLQKAIAENIKEASDVWKINSTPSFVVNDGERVIYGGKPYEAFEKLVQQLAPSDAAATSSPAPAKAEPMTEVTEEIKDLEAQAEETIEGLEAEVEEIEAEIQDVIEENTETIKDNAVYE